MTKRNRQLAAIVFTDIVGYASLMRTDEAMAAEMRRRHRSIFDLLTPKYGGKILQYYGDGTLSIFSSAVAAVECAVEMQRSFRQEPVVPLRIAIHTGDIAYDDMEVFGDGLNVAARIEPCCIAGGIYVTSKVFDDIKNHDWLSARELGDFTFKGMEEPLRLYAIDNAGVSVPTDADIRELQHTDAKLVTIMPAPQKPVSLVPEWVRQSALLSIPVLLLGLILAMLFSRPDPQIITLALPPEAETSIAVLPFNNLSEQAENEYFSDGITEDILALLSRIQGLKVVSRASVMSYKDTKKPSREIARELQADKILRGSVRRDGDKVRIAAQLIDGQDDHQIWAETYDREITEIFDVQSRVAQDIASALSRSLTESERAQLWKKPTRNLKAYELYLKGREYYFRYTTRDNEEAIGLFRKALEADPGFAQAYAGLGDALAQKAFKSGMKSNLLDSAIAMSTRAITLDKNLSEGYKALGLAYHYQGQYEQALSEYQKAVKRNPNNAMAIHNIGAIYQEQGNFPQAICWTERSISINPHHALSLLNLAQIFYTIGDDERTLEIIGEGQRYDAGYAPFRMLLAALFLRQENLPAAKEQALQLIADGTDEAGGYRLMGEIALLEDNLADAEAFFREANLLTDKEEMAYARLFNDLSLAYIDLKTGQAAVGRTRLQALLPGLKTMASEKGKADLFVVVSMGYALLGDEAQALQWLQDAVDHNWLDYQVARRHPFFENLRDTPRFRQLIQQVETRVSKIRQEVSAVRTEGRMSLGPAEWEVESRKWKAGNGKSEPFPDFPLCIIPPPWKTS